MWFTRGRARHVVFGRLADHRCTLTALRASPLVRSSGSTTAAPCACVSCVRARALPVGRRYSGDDVCGRGKRETDMFGRGPRFCARAAVDVRGNLSAERAEKNLKKFNLNSIRGDSAVIAIATYCKNA